MTIRIKITHLEKGNDKPIEFITSDSKHPQVILPGEEATVYLYGERSVTVYEQSDDLDKQAKPIDIDSILSGSYYGS